YSDLIVHRLIKAILNNDTNEGSYVLRNIEMLAIAISEKEREADTIEVEYQARKFARWALLHIGEHFYAKITSTTPEVRAELDDEIKGAKLTFLASTTQSLFEKVRIKIEKVDIAKAKIYASIIEEENV
ncbi:MAG: exoribonuclease II, partial [Epsilonproteobacteria bacterium]|nr:exoribonuclease II [Campylobacterota bacterium]